MALNNVKNILAVASGKGGVGKSTIATQLAYSLKKLKYSVGILDADIYGPSVAKMLHASGKKLDSTRPIISQGISFISMSAITDETSPVVWRAPMATKFIQQFLGNIEWGELDYLIIDCPPGTGDVQITLAQSANLDAALIVTTPQDVAVSQAQKGLKMFEQVNVPILGVVENMSGFFGTKGGQELASKHKTTLLASIPLDQHVVMASEAGEQVNSPIIDELAKKVVDGLVKIKDHFKRTVPTSFQVNKSGALEIHWPNSQITLLEPRNLRLHCPCAKCVDENSGQRIVKEDQIPQDISIISVGMVGRYALAPKFSDNHQFGLYKFDYLKQIANQPSSKANNTAFVATEKPKVEESSLVAQVQKMLDGQLNEQIKSHHGYIKVEKVEGSVLFVCMQGGCQGCSQAAVTLSSGVEKAIKEHFPQITQIVDLTKHEQGENPYFKSTVVEKKEVTFYFDFFSPFSYLAYYYWKQERSVWNNLANFTLTPVPLVNLLSHYGQIGPGAIESKRVFLHKQIMRRVERDKIPFVGPKNWPFNSSLALRIVCAGLIKQMPSSEMEKLIDQIWVGLYEKGADAEDEQFFREVEKNLNFTSDELRKLANSSQARSLLKTLTSQAIEQGAFGVPTFIVHSPSNKFPNELFWGADSLGDLAKFLSQK